jgi:hypothetical protein
MSRPAAGTSKERCVMTRNVLLGGVVLALLSTKAFAQITVTPTLMPPPPGQFVVVNNGPADQSDPHVSGNLVTYSNSDGTNFTIHYFDLVTNTDRVVPNSGSFDFLPDVSGSTIAFTRVNSFASAIFSYTVGASSAVEVNPMPATSRQSAQIGTSTIAWQDFGSGVNADIVVYDIASGTTTKLINDLLLNQTPAISPDGTAITWARCATVSAPCDIWSAVRTGTNWTVQQLTSGNGACTHPDTNGQVVVYSCNRGAGDQLYWQLLGGGVEYHLAFNGTASVPSISGQLVSFAGLTAASSFHHIYVLDISSLMLYQITNTPYDNELNDISVTPDGTVRVVWQASQADVNVYAYTFSLPVDESAISNLLGQLVTAGCIDNAGIANALTSKLDVAQAASDPQTAINTLTALKHQIQAQSGKHIATSCTIAGAAFNPVFVLLEDVQKLIDSLNVAMTPDPITGSVVDSNGVGVAGATLAVIDGGGHAVATAVTDITGFYFIATTGGVLTPGANYTLAVSGLPAGFSTVTPANQPFQWQGMATSFSSFVLN